MSVEAEASNRALATSRASLCELRSEVHGLKSELQTSFRTAAGEFMQFKTEVTKAMTKFKSDADDANERYLKELKERRRLHNLVAELKGNIRVFCRIRPASKDELATGDKVGITTVVRPPHGGASVRARLCACCRE